VIDEETAMYLGYSGLDDDEDELPSDERPVPFDGEGEIGFHIEDAIGQDLYPSDAYFNDGYLGNTDIYEEDEWEGPESVAEPEGY
jgi:hypothetical protein